MVEEKIKIKAKELEDKYNISYYESLQRFMFERILERISVSKYQDNFILKGGLLLAAMFGVENRTTKDMDATITGIDISKSKMVNILNEIDVNILKDAINNTFSKRGSFEYLNDYSKIVKSIIDSERIKENWNSYSKKNSYANNIEVDQIMFLLNDFIKELNLVLVTV